MSRSLRRGAAAALVLAAIVPLSACASGNDASTLQIKPDNAATAIGSDVKLNNIVVVAPEGSAGEYSGPAAVTVNIANTSTQEEVLTSVKIGDVTAALTDESGAAVQGVVIAPGGSVLLGAQGSPVAQASSAKVFVGGYVKTTFTFKNAGEVSTDANVQPAVALYKDFGPKTAKATATASPTAGATGSPSPTAGATGSPTAGATASGSPSAPAGTTSPSPSAR